MSVSKQTTERRSITVDEAMTLAVECLKRDLLDDAGALLGRILELVPDHAPALHFSGVLAHKRRRTGDAVALMRRSIALAPGQADWHSNLGITLQAVGEVDGAIAEFERAISLAPEHINAHNNLGVLLRVNGRLEEAEACYRRAIALDPEHADAYHNLAIVLDLTRRTPEAVLAYCRALTLRPHQPETRRQLALAYCTLGRPDLAVQLCEEWMRLEPGNALARHTLAACSGRDVPPRAADEYVRLVFDSFSTSFEVKLARLHYRAPDLVLEAVAASGALPDAAFDVLDAGCGTGLCGPRLAPYARRLVGVDLSPGMLEHARAKAVYHELVEGELTAYLERQRLAFDVIVSADTLVYFGALEDFVTAAAAALRPGGQVIFTLEAAGEESAAPFTLKPHGRYTHRRDYVERLLREAGLQPSVTEAELRMEAGAPVSGLVVRAARAAEVRHA